MTERTPGELWLLELERERNDISYRKLAPQAEQPQVKVKEVVRTVVKLKDVDPKEQQKRDQIMYHAGRFAAGVRDAEAINGFKNMQKLLGIETNE